MKKQYLKPATNELVLETGFSLLAGSLKMYDVEATEQLSNERSGSWDSSQWNEQ